MTCTASLDFLQDFKCLYSLVNADQMSTGNTSGLRVIGLHSSLNIETCLLGNAATLLAGQLLVDRFKNVWIRRPSDCHSWWCSVIFRRVLDTIYTSLFILPDVRIVFEI